jgi:transcription antitermination factor NusG
MHICMPSKRKPNEVLSERAELYSHATYSQYKLPARPESMNPETSRSQFNFEWFAVHTRSRHEKSVSEQLRGKEIETFLPLYRSGKRWKNGQAGGELPLFSGYVFVRIDGKKTLPVLQTPGVASFVGFGGGPAPIPDFEIEQLETIMSKGLDAYPHPYLSVGQRVQIQCGPLAGLTGIMTRDKGKDRVVLSVELISRSISVELDFADLAVA